MVSLSLNVAGNKRGSVKLKRFDKQLVPNLIRGIDKSTALLEREIKKNLRKGGSAPRGKDAIPTKNTGKHLRYKSGNLAASWKMQAARRTATNVEGHVTSSSDYAAIHEFGGTIPAKTIKPRNAKALRFYVKGEPVFAKVVNRPAVTIPERPYVQPALDDNTAKIQTIIGREITKPLRGRA